MRITAGVKRVDKRKMEELMEEVAVKESFRIKLVRSRLKWAVHVDRLAGVLLYINKESRCIERGGRRSVGLTMLQVLVPRPP